MFAVTVYGGDRNRLPISSVALLTDSPRDASATEAPFLDASRKRPPHAAATEGPAFADRDRHVHGKELHIRLHIRVSVQASHRCRPRKAGLRPRSKARAVMIDRSSKCPVCLGQRPAAPRQRIRACLAPLVRVSPTTEVVAGARGGIKGNAARCASISDSQLLRPGDSKLTAPHLFISPPPHRPSQLPRAHDCCSKSYFVKFSLYLRTSHVTLTTDANPPKTNTGHPDGLFRVCEGLWRSIVARARPPKRPSARARPPKYVVAAARATGGRRPVAPTTRRQQASETPPVNSAYSGCAERLTLACGQLNYSFAAQLTVIRSYHQEYRRSHQNSQLKPAWAGLVLG